MVEVLTAVAMVEVLTAVAMGEVCTTVKTASTVTAAMKTSAVRPTTTAARASKRGFAGERAKHKERQRECNAQPPHDSATRQ